MKLRLFSDIHIEFDRGYKNPTWFPIELPEDKDTVLILAGDIEVAKRTRGYVESLADRFKAIVYVLGNHDLYGGNLDKEYVRAASDLDNVHLLQNDFVVIDGVKILGTTLWTDMYRANPLTVWNAKNAILDFKKIKTGESYSRFTVARWMYENRKASRFLEEEVDPGCIVVTHHAPSFVCRDTDFIVESNNYYYNMDMEDLISRAGLWLFGHTHEAFDAEICGTRVVSNPRGYSVIDGGAHLVEEFNPEGLINF